MGRGAAGLIGHTQPRRIAARSIAARIAEEIGSPLGRDVGYKVRFSEAIGPQSYIKLMTDGILLAETQSDPVLQPVRHDHPRRGPRAVAERRFPHRLPETAAAQAAGPAADHHLGDDRRGPLRRTFLHRGRPGAGDRGLGTDLSGGSPLAADGSRTRRATSPTCRMRCGRRWRRWPASIAATCSSSCPRNATSTRRPRRSAAGRCRATAPGQETEILPLYARLSIQEQQRVFQPRAPGRGGGGHRHQRGRVVAHRAADPLRDRSRHGADQPLFAALEDPAAADRGGVAGLGRSAQGALRTRGPGDLPAAVQRAGLSLPATASRCPRSSGRTWPR